MPASPGPLQDGGGFSLIVIGSGISGLFVALEARLGDHDGFQARGLAAQGGGESRDPGADDHDVRGEGPAGGGRVQSYASTCTCAIAGHEAAPKVRGMLSISRVVPTRAATARTASPVKSSSISVKSDGSTSAR